MPFDPIDRELAQEKKVLILVTVLFFHLILISSQIILKNQHSLLVSVAARIVSPLQVSIQKTADFFANVSQRYVFLKGIYHKYQREKKKSLTLRQENFHLRSQLRQYSLQFRAKQKFSDFLLVHLISVDSSFPYNTVVIDQGSASRILPNLPIVNLDGELFGKTIEPITRNTATVRMITSPIGGVGAYLEKNMFEGFVSGGNANFCLFKYLLENKPVSIGDRVVTSGNDMIFPPFIPIGKVERIQKEYLSPKVYIRPFFLQKPIKDLVVLLK